MPGGATWCTRTWLPNGRTEDLMCGGLFLTAGTGNPILRTENVSDRAYQRPNLRRTGVVVETRVSLLS
jgi:hypothetical protein